MALAAFLLVFVAATITMLATGLGALPFLFVDDVSDRLNVALWGVASGIMVSASVFGLLFEARAVGGPVQIGAGVLLGVALVTVSQRLIDDHDFLGSEDGHEHEDPQGADGHDHGGHGHSHDHAIDPETYASADLKTLVLVVGVLTVHSFPEGVAVGVAFAELGLVEGVSLAGFSIPILAVFMTVAISIHNVPEGVAVSIPLQSMGASVPRMVFWSVFTSVPQPIGAVIAFGFVRYARDFLPFGFGFAAGAMIWLVAVELIPEGRRAGADLPDDGTGALVGGFLAGLLFMLPLVFV